MMVAPQSGTVAAPQGVQGPAATAAPPTAGHSGGGGQPPAAIASQQQQGIDPGTPLNGEDSGLGLPALLVAQAEIGFEFMMGDLDFLALPSPEEELLHGQGQAVTAGGIGQGID